MFYTNSDHLKFLLTHLLLHRPVWRGFSCFNCSIFSLPLLNFFSSFFLLVQEVSKESQELMRKALEEVTLSFLPNFTFPFCGLKDGVDVARLFPKKTC